MPSRDAPLEVVFRILGPIEIVIGGEHVEVPAGRQQIILGALLLDANRVVSRDSLIDAVWGERPPSTARSQVQICVSALRQLFKNRGVPSPIVTRARGYLVEVPDDGLDVNTFGRLVREADDAARAGRLAESVDLLTEGLGLWRGPVLGGDVGATLHSRVVRLDEERLRALENRIDLELRLGRSHRLVGEVSGLVEEYPLRERLRGLLMLALYRSGRSAEALEVYRVGRETIIAELGLEPGDELKQLHVAILTEDDTIAVEPEKPPTAEAPPPINGPHQLPADIADFAGRETLVAAAEAVLAEPGQHVRVLMIAGKPGIGKTTLAVHVAHRVHARHFPAGQLYCNVAGMRDSAVTTTAVLARFLRALGVPGASIPDNMDERAEMYRSLLDGRRMLVVLDDVTSESQIAPLLPGSESCAVIVTSRTRLGGISGAKLLDVDVLRPEQALRLLGTVIGADRVEREPAAARALVSMVGGLPLALRIVAARLAARPHWSLASMLGRLTDERHRLDELAYGDMVVRASLSLTYDGLDPYAARLFRLLALTNLESVPPWMGAALLDDDVTRSTEALDLLVDTQMVEVAGIDGNGRPRYGFHDIIRVFAREQLAQNEQPATRSDALRRVLGGWLALLDKAHSAIYGGDYTVVRGSAPRWQPPAGVFEDPLRWLEDERVNLCLAVGEAADADLDELSWELAVRLVTLFEAHSYFDEWQQTHERALAAVRRAGNRRGEAALLCSLGSLHLSRQRLAAARTVLAPAFVLFSELGDDRGLAITQRNLALLDYAEGDVARSVGEYQAALAAFRRADDPIGQAHVLSQVARIELDDGDYTSAVDHLNEALAICREVGGLRVEAQVLYRFGEAMFRQRRYEQARLVMDVVLDMVRRHGDEVGESHALHTLGLVHGKVGDPEQSATLLRAAIEIRERISDQAGAAQVALDLAVLLGEQGDLGQAVELAEQATKTFAARRLPVWEAEARRVFESLADGGTVRVDAVQIDDGH